jgi:hypothetical protein
MSAALGTLPFLATLWLLMVLGAKGLEESGAKVAAALKGLPPPLRETPVQVRCRVRSAVRPARPANVEWRAAA